MLFRSHSQTPPLPGMQSDSFCFSDGSWGGGWDGGIGFIIFSRGELVAYRSAARKGCSPLQLEAQALLEAINFVSEAGIEECHFYSDCSNLVKACNQDGAPIACDWKAFSEVLHCWKKFKLYPKFSCFQVQRSAIEVADVLANLGRRGLWETTGFTFPLFPQFFGSYFCVQCSVFFLF